VRVLDRARREQRGRTGLVVALGCHRMAGPRVAHRGERGFEAIALGAAIDLERGE
jgi:hypothetical protein